MTDDLIPFYKLKVSEKKSLAFFASLKYIFSGQVAHKSQLPGRVVSEIENGLKLNLYKQKQMDSLRRIGFNIYPEQY